MQAPICEKCVRSGVLCEKCRKKLDNKEITHTDIDLAALLQDMESKEFVREPSFTKTHDVGSLLLVLTPGDAASLIGKKGRVVRHLSQELRKTVRIIKEGDLKTKIGDLVAPARLLGINVAYKPEGQETRLIIPREDEEKLITDLETMEEAARLLASDESLVIVLK